MIGRNRPGETPAANTGGFTAFGKARHIKPVQVDRHIYLNAVFVRDLLKKIRNCATMVSLGLCPMRPTG